MGQFTVIITEDINRTRISIKNGRDEKLEVKSRNYVITETSHRILLKAPRAGELRGYQADVVINQTEHPNITNIAAKKDAVTVDFSEDNSVDFEQKLKEKTIHEHGHETDTHTIKSGEQAVYICNECDRSLGTKKEVEKWFEKEIL